MMRKLFFILVSLHLIIQGACYCQKNTFDYLLSSPGNDFVYDLYEADDGNIYLSGFVTRPYEGTGKAKAIVIKLNNEGSYVDSVVYNIKDRRFCFTNILPDTNDCLILSGYSSDTVMQALITYSNCKLELKRINSNLELQSDKTLEFPPDYRYYNMITCKGLNNDLIISGSIMPDNVPYIFYYILNHNLDSIRANFYLDKYRTCYATKQIKDSVYWICDGIKSSYYQLDNALLLTEYNYARPHSIVAHYGIKWESNASFYLAGQWNGGSGNDIAFFKQFHPFDSTSNIFNSWGTLDTLDLPATTGALDYKNNDSIFIGGTTNYWFTYSQTPSWYFIIQTDSNLNVRWERFYGGNARYTMRKIIASNDGGCIIAGTRYDYQNVTEEELDIHILKLNSEGLLVGTNDIHPSIKMQEALVFPNPGTKYLKVRIATQYKQSTFELYDMFGRQILSQQITGKWAEVSTDHLSSGAYIYKIYNGEGLHESGKWIKQ